MSTTGTMTSASTTAITITRTMTASARCCDAGSRASAALIARLPESTLPAVSDRTAQAPSSSAAALRLPPYAQVRDVAQAVGCLQPQPAARVALPGLPAPLHFQQLASRSPTEPAQSEAPHWRHRVGSVH